MSQEGRLKVALKGKGNPLGEVDYRSWGELTKDEQEQFERYLQKRIEAIRDKHPGAYQNHTPLSEVKKAG